MAKTVNNDMLLLQCGKIVNETWSKASLHYEYIKEIVEKGGPENEQEEAIMMIAANATLQKMTLDRVSDERYIF